MNKREIFSMIYRNKHSRKQAIIYIADFLCKTYEEAAVIFDYEYPEYLEEMNPNC